MGVVSSQDNHLVNDYFTRSCLPISNVQNINGCRHIDFGFRIDCYISGDLDICIRVVAGNVSKSYVCAFFDFDFNITVGFNIVELNVGFSVVDRIHGNCGCGTCEFDSVKNNFSLCGNLDFGIVGSDSAYGNGSSEEHDFAGCFERTYKFGSVGTDDCEFIGEEHIAGENDRFSLAQGNLTCKIRVVCRDFTLLIIVITAQEITAVEQSAVDCYCRIVCTVLIIIILPKLDTSVEGTAVDNGRSEALHNPFDCSAEVEGTAVDGKVRSFFDLEYRVGVFLGCECNSRSDSVLTENHCSVGPEYGSIL